jgi:putative nucleotidyltransferase with HDIG domain
MRATPTTFVPRTASGEIHWEALSRDYGFFSAMANTPQSSQFHAEGDVLTHTKMVAEHAERLASEHGLDDGDRDLLVAGAIFHDCGKPSTLVMEGAEPCSPRHAAAGARLLRQIWWERGWFPHDRREQVLALVRFHAAPVRLLDKTREPDFQMG